MTSFRILIVDDQRDVRRLFADGLQMLGPGMDILELPSGEEALLVAFRKTIHLVITDIKLPGISGFDLVKRIRKNNPDLKIILITGLTAPQIQEQVGQIEADAFFFKPVGIGELLDAAKKCLGIGEALPEAEGKEEGGERPVSEPDETQPVVLKPAEKELPEVQIALRTLREQLKAKTVAFIDSQGKVLAQVGEVDLITDSTLVTRLLATLKNSLEVSHSLSQGFQSSLLCFSGAENYLCMVPVGTSRALLVVGGQAFQASLLSPGRRITSTAVELQKLVNRVKEPVLEEVTAPVVPEEPAVIEEVVEEATPEDLAAMDALFNQAAENDMKKADLDAFWSSLVENSDQSEGKENGFLSYDEARKLGLTPE